MTALEDIAAERRRQIEGAGFSLEHDDEHDRGELAFAAAAYAFRVGQITDPIRHPADEAAFSARAPVWWPWKPEEWKASSLRRMLVKAGALIVAEIERLDREAARDEGRREGPRPGEAYDGGFIGSDGDWHGPT
jgi:hypothetical protein